MKINPSATSAFLDDPPADLRAVLLFGPDEGLIRERAEGLVKKVVGEDDNPFRIVHMNPADLTADPGCVRAEALAVVFGGGRKAISIRGVKDAHTEAFRRLLEDTPGDALVIAEGGGLSPRSALRKTFETQKMLAAVGCYGDDGQSLIRVIEGSLAKHDKRLDRDARAYLQANLGADRLVTRSELDKLALYMGEETEISLEDARACVGDSAAVSLDALTTAVGLGDQAGLETAMRRCLDEGKPAIVLLRTMARHLYRLLLARAHMARGQTPAQAVKNLSPPVFFKQVDGFIAQLRLWNEKKLAGALDLLTEAECLYKTGKLPADAHCHRTFMRIAQAAKRG